MGHSRSSGLSRSGASGGGAGTGGGGAFRAGATANYTDDYGANHEVKVLRKLSNAEAQERAFLANPDARGGYYEVEDRFGSKSIVWAGRLQRQNTSTGGGSFKPSQRVSFNSGFGDAEGHIVRKLPDRQGSASSPRADKGGYYEVAIDRGNAFVSSGESYIVGASQLKLLKNRGR